MKVVVHNGIVWAYRVSGGWYTHLKPFPQAVKKIWINKAKDEYEYVADPDHLFVIKYVKDNTHA